ncbi:MFS transporter [Chloroflexota bacterium]
MSKIFYGWWIVIACFLMGLFGNGIIAYCFTGFIEPIAREFGWSYAQISLAASIRGLEVGLAAPILGWFIDRWGSRRVVFCCSLILCLGLFLLSRTMTLAVFYIAFILIGIGVSGFTLPIITITVANWFRKRISVATGIAISGASIGGLLLPLLTHIMESQGWRLAVLVILLGVVIIVLPLSLLLRYRPEQCGLLPDGKKEIDPTAQEIPENEKPQNLDPNLKQALRNNVFWRLSIAFTSSHFIAGALITQVMPYLSSIGINRYIASIIASSIPVMSIVGRLSMGFFGDRFNKKLVTAATFIMIGLAMFLFSFTGTFGIWLAVISLILFGIGYGGGITMAGPITRVFFGRNNFGVIFGSIMGITQIGNIASAPLAGWVYDKWGTYQWFWLFTSAIAILAAIILLTSSSQRIKE